VNGNLLKAIGIITDVSKLYVPLFEDIKSRKFFVRLVYNTYSFFHPSFISTLMIACYGAKSFFSLKLEGNKNASILLTATVTNEIKHAKYFIKNVGEEKIIIANSRIINLLSFRTIKLFFYCVINWKKVKQFFLVIKYINNKHDFMPSCRTASTIGFYIRFLYEIENNNLKAIAIVSDYSPDGLGLSYAARTLDLKTIYMTHAFIHHNFSLKAQSFSLLFIQGKKSFDNYNSYKENVSDKVVFLGIDGKSVPMKFGKLKNKGNNIGVFLTAPLNTDDFRNNIQNILEALQPKKLIIRPHPGELQSINMNSFIKGYDNIILSQGRTIDEDIRECDLAIVGNSSAALEILKSGLPCVYYHGFEKSKYDYCGFIGNKLIPEIKNFQEISADKIRQWYDNSEWVDLFMEYDPLYKNPVVKGDIIRQEVEDLLKQVPDK